jgi:hypothetical protein
MKLIGGESVKRVYSLNMLIMDVGNLLNPPPLTIFLNFNPFLIYF